MTTLDQFIWCVVFAFIGGIIEPGDIKSIATQGFPYKTVNAPSINWALLARVGKAEKLLISCRIDWFDLFVHAMENSIMNKKVISKEPRIWQKKETVFSSGELENLIQSGVVFRYTSSPS
ncbi:hypothetical protein MG293_017086 [Ovis ammon polii]|uniref:Uncharacterized protein n=1 Tax=Ovis ammon polii TaxID=230172 RepID=A0AAD4Y2Y4_OVIAM|nr:hypothetical protein MG293_017086 [Ovis ammon polii]